MSLFKKGLRKSGQKYRVEVPSSKDLKWKTENFLPTLPNTQFYSFTVLFCLLPVCGLLTQMGLFFFISLPECMNVCSLGISFRYLGGFGFISSDYDIFFN